MTISVEAYLSVINYEGLSAKGAPIRGHVLVVKDRPLSETLALLDGPVISSRKKRSRHWAGVVQQDFSRWLSGKGEKIDGIPYSLTDLRTHLERQFSRGMAWENYAGCLPYYTEKRRWVVDHIVPKRLFGMEQLAEAYALTNLRPLWMDENMRKSGLRQHLL